MYNYQKDHLGNVRVVFNERDSAASAMAWAAQCRTISTQARSSRVSMPSTGTTTVHGGMPLQY